MKLGQIFNAGFSVAKTFVQKVNTKGLKIGKSKTISPKMVRCGGLGAVGVALLAYGVANNIKANKAEKQNCGLIEQQQACQQEMAKLQAQVKQLQENVTAYESTQKEMEECAVPLLVRTNYTESLDTSYFKGTKKISCISYIGDSNASDPVIQEEYFDKKGRKTFSLNGVRSNYAIYDKDGALETSVIKTKNGGIRMIIYTKEGLAKLERFTDKNGQLLKEKHMDELGVLDYTVFPKYDKEGTLIGHDVVFNQENK